METSIRPLTLGEILDRTAQLYRSNFVLFAGIFAIYAGMVMVLNLIQLGIMTEVNFVRASIGLKILLSGALAVKLFLVIAAACATTAAINRAVAWVHLGQPATIATAYKSTMPRLGRYLWLTAIAYFVVIWPFLVAVGILLGLTLAIPGFMGGSLRNSTPGQAAGVLAFVVLIFIFLFLLVWIAYAIFMGIRYSLAVPACVMEDLKARAAIKRSIALTKGSRGRIFVLLLLVLAIDIGLGLVGQSFLFVLAIKHHGQLGVVAQSISQIIAFFTNTFLGPIYATGITLFYYDQRIRKEGFDIEWMMSAAGMTPSSISAAVSSEVLLAIPQPLDPPSGAESAHE
jgi:hypothetical protein